MPIIHSLRSNHTRSANTTRTWAKPAQQQPWATQLHGELATTLDPPISFAVQRGTECSRAAKTHSHLDRQGAKPLYVSNVEYSLHS